MHHLFISLYIRLVSSVMNNVGRGLNIALVNGKISVTSRNVDLLSEIPICTKPHLKQYWEMGEDCQLKLNQRVFWFFLLQGSLENSWSPRALICGQEVMNTYRWICVYYDPGSGITYGFGQMSIQFLQW